MFDITNTKLFYDTTKEEAEDIKNCLGFKENGYEKDTLLFGNGETFTAGIVLEGTVDTVLFRPDGRKILIRRLKKGDSFVYRQTGEEDLNMMAASDVKILFIDSSTIFDPKKADCPHRRRIMENIIRILSDENTFLYFKTALFTERSLRQKILFYLTPGNEKKTFSRQSLADYLGSDRSALSRELNRMEKEGLIKLDGRRIELAE